MAGDVVLQHLEYLQALASERHFGRAATACNVSQPTLSAAIRKLEHELDVVIVRRRHRFEGLTTDGERVVIWARRILAERDELIADLARARGGLSTIARIGAIPTAVPATPVITAQFLKQHPGAKVRIEALSSREIARKLAEFELDAGLTYLDDETPPGTHRIKLYQERYALVAPAEHPIMAQAGAEVSWAEATGLPLCALTTAMRNRRILETNAAAAGAHFVPVVEADTVAALYAHLAGLQLASIVAHTWLHAFGVPDGLAVRPMVQLEPGPWVGLIAPDREPQSVIAEALIAAAADPKVSQEFHVPTRRRRADRDAEAKRADKLHNSAGANQLRPRRPVP